MARLLRVAKVLLQWLFPEELSAEQTEVAIALEMRDVQF